MAFRSCKSPALAPLALGIASAFGAHAQSASIDPQTLPPVTVTGRAPDAIATIGGFGELPLSKLPLQATVVTGVAMKDAGVQSLADITRFDASLGDAYNSEGYWTTLMVRGFATDNRFNFRRDGLPINAETSLPLANKERIEILKGASGMQAGTSAPGGLVNLVVKRPEGTVRSAALEWRQSHTWRGGVDIGQRFGEGEAFGLRVNAQSDELDPQTHDLHGHSQLLAVAGDWRVTPDTLLEAEFETSHRSQPSVPAMSLLGNRLPDASAYDPRTNLNNQPWSQPVVLDGDTASLRWQQRLSADWRAVAHLATQRLTSDDRLAFPYGCGAEGNYDRYCSDGTFDLYDFRSDNERRTTDALDLGVRGSLSTAGIAHELQTGVLLSRFRSRLQGQAYNYAGVGNIDGSLVTPAAPELTAANTNRDERNTELYVRDAITLTPTWSAWLGLRHTQLKRESIATDGSEPVSYTDSFTTPWLALSHALQPGLLAYASWGQGIESEVAPNRARYTNAGQALAPLKSRQMELGLKGTATDLSWGLTVFDIVRPRFADVGSDCASDTVGNTCTHQEDGEQRHRGLEADSAWSVGDWTLQGAAMWLHARVEDVTSDTTLNGKRPVNVPDRTLKLNVSYRVPLLTGLNLSAGAVHEGERMVLQDNSLSIPGWTRFDAAARYEQRLAGVGTLTWRVGVDNLSDRRAWKESPLQFGHVYLYPLAPRTVRASVQIDL
ncbi:TonB-dependent siderophore receptor [Rhizobacter sp. SG703]|uniref:TonB-dependent siderophore receptor n=1 Tax=Rhizobacter sp. SG703 TaxID=2587140 RepID=UPI00144514C2|nr:TonB-dependent siderophore receptor [Rhizobacter sp. SG703]NKI97520.1 iron complex outermembrane receptor protein [Rhizobacter sp. SG703]